MRREGSPWQGLGTVFVKELADHISSARMLVLEILFLLIACVVVYFAIDQIRQTTAEDPFVLLKLFTAGRSSLLSLLAILGILIPLVAIGLGFDAVNGEHNRRTLSRILSQPIYRDALLAGKFLAALATLGISLVCLWLLVIGLGIILLGVPPSGEEIVRSLAFLFVTLAYAGIWLALAILLSIVFRSAATAALVALGLWLFLTLIWPMLAPAFANVISPPDVRYLLVGVPSPNTAAWERALNSISPNQLYGEAAAALLAPEARAVGTTDYIGYLTQLQGAIRGSVLPLKESLAIAWPQTVSLIAGVIVLFVAGYVVFQRQEVRA
ncbi:MAG TPA: ABC transporter permease subunit [Xanthobacteraceae bacterium]|nr:ABC transporter permease subunit [Xanthobacteraceae bacterium]